MRINLFHLIFQLEGQLSLSSNPKEKGSSNERKLSRQLSLWFTNGESDDIFWRSTNSGGTATIRGKKEKNNQNAYVISISE